MTLDIISQLAGQNFRK